jgi:hypothetical protein
VSHVLLIGPAGAVLYDGATGALMSEARGER